MGQMSLKATFLYYYSHTPASPVPICPFGWRWYLRTRGIWPIRLDSIYYIIFVDKETWYAIVSD